MRVCKYVSFKWGVIGLLSILILISCSARNNLAPVIDLHAKTKKNSFSTKQYTVNKGDTLYSIAWRHDMDYRQLATLNRLSSPYALRIDQKITLSPKRTKQTFRVSKANNSHRSRRAVFSTKPSKVLSWRWPMKGKIVNSYAPYRGNKGIDIAGFRQQKIMASAGGRVAYAGNGLPGYGNLIIIKHKNNFLSAYAYNKRLLVKEGQLVKTGQVIATMGRINSQQWGVHFEIRKAGKPVNPLKFLS